MQNMLYMSGIHIFTMYAICAKYAKYAWYKPIDPILLNAFYSFFCIFCIFETLSVPHLLRLPCTSTGVGWGPSIGLAVRKNQSKSMPLKRIDLAKALDYTSF